MTPTPEPSEFYELLRRIAAQPDVVDVLVQVTAFDAPEWPFSDTVWVITSANPEAVRAWFPDEVRPDECWRGWTEVVKFEPYSVSPRMHPVACWWD